VKFGAVPLTYGAAPRHAIFARFVGLATGDGVAPAEVGLAVANGGADVVDDGGELCVPPDAPPGGELPIVAPPWQPTTVAAPTSSVAISDSRKCEVIVETGPRNGMKKNYLVNGCRGRGGRVTCFSKKRLALRFRLDAAAFLWPPL
jgi:hypothetical protein